MPTAYAEVLCPIERSSEASEALKKNIGNKMSFRDHGHNFQVVSVALTTSYMIVMRKVRFARLLSQSGKASPIEA